MLATKLRPPHLRSTTIGREKLMRRLTDAFESGRQLTLISAPAGYGKTTCAAEWAASLNIPVGWVSLDRSDNDPAAFLEYLIAALQQVDSAIGQGALRAMRSASLPPVEALVTSLINDAVQSGVQCVLVLDDLQVISEAPTIGALTALVANQPENVHLVLATREDPPLPLARLRANNRLSEVRSSDLRLDRADAARFLSETMGLRLTPADVAILEEKTEGWICGLQLVALCLRERADVSDFVRRLSGNHRHIGSYLTEEVLSRQEPEVKEFLLQTAILDRLSAPLCDALTGRTESALLLNRIARANLFLIPLDDDGYWYRYHHLFADILRTIRASDQDGLLHRRASSWYADQGMVREAVEHAIAGADYSMAAQLVDAHATDLVLQGHAKTVDEWLNALPAETRLASPRANFAFTWMNLMRGSFAAAAPYIQRIQDTFAQSEPLADSAALRAEWLALQSFLLVGQGKAAEGVELARRALDCAPASDGYVLGLAYNGLASAYYALGDHRNVVDVCLKAIRHSRAAGNLASELMSVSILAEIALRYGEYRLGLEAITQVMPRLEGMALPPPVGSVTYVALARIYCEWCRFDEAVAYLRRAIALAGSGVYVEGEAHCRATWSRVLRLAGDEPGAERESGQALGLLPAGGSWARSEAIAERVQTLLDQRLFTAAEALLGQEGLDIRGFGAPQQVTHESGLLLLSGLRVRLWRAENLHEHEELGHALEVASNLVRQALDQHLLPLALEALLVRARLFLLLGDRHAALRDCAEALERAEPAGALAVFAQAGAPLAELLGVSDSRDQAPNISPEFRRAVRSALGEYVRPTPLGQSPHSGGGADSLQESLSPRELEVLSLIAAGFSNRDIAARLFVSVHTVKKHTGNLFAKLEVSSRTQAVARARQLELLPQPRD